MLQQLRNLLGLNPPLPNVENVLRDVQSGNLSVDDAAEKIRDDATRPYLPPWSLRLLRFVGVLFAMVGFALGIYSMSVGLGKSVTRGTVIEMVGSEMTSPVVEYQVNGNKHRIQGSVSSSPPAHVVGDLVDVIYDESNPSNSKIDTFRERWLFPVAFAGAGLNAILLSFALPWIFNAIFGANHAMDRSRG
jgi:hypothetical protein